MTNQFNQQEDLFSSAHQPLTTSGDYFSTLNIDDSWRQVLAPIAPDINAMGDFLAAEQAMRELAGLPPYGRLAAVILSSPDPVALETTARAFAAAAPNAEGVEVYGPADAPLALIRGRRRKRLLAKSSRNVDLSAYMAAWRARVKIPASVRLRIDVDPYSFL